MKMNKSSKELLQRYLLAVKRELGGKQREDIAAEIESYIFDLLEERHPKAKEIGKSELEAILKEMGAPRKVAAQYSPNRYLIGPRLFPVYWLVVRIVIAVVFGSITLSLLINAIINPPIEIGASIFEYLGTVWSGILSAAGAVTLVFAAIDRATEGKPIDEIEELQELDLSELPELPETEKEVSIVETSFEIFFGILGIVFFTYVQKTGGYLPAFKNPAADAQMARIFTDGFLRFIPVLLALNGLEVARSITLLVQRHHSALTNWWQIAQECAQIVLNGFLLGALPLITLEFFDSFMDIENLTKVESIANTGLAVILVLSMIGMVASIITRVVREVRSPGY